MGAPLWRRAFDAVGRPVGRRLEQVVQTERFADVAGAALRLRAAVDRRVERTSRRALHRANLPAATDVARLREQVASLERTVRRLDDALRQAGGPDGQDGRPGGGRQQGAARRRPQPAARPQRREVRDGHRPPEGGADA